MLSSMHACLLLPTSSHSPQLSQLVETLLGVGANLLTGPSLHDLRQRLP